MIVLPIHRLAHKFFDAIFQATLPIAQSWAPNRDESSLSETSRPRQAQNGLVIRELLPLMQLQNPVFLWMPCDGICFGPLRLANEYHNDRSLLSVL